MTPTSTLRHEFIEYVPDKLQDDVLYVSLRYATVVHKCCCGCGNEVVTPLSPTDWKLIFDGESITLHPSIGNWNYPCQSHYWITGNHVRWAEQWSPARIEAGRAHDRAKKIVYFDDTTNDQHATSPMEVSTPPAPPRRDLLSRIRSWLGL